MSTISTMIIIAVAALGLSYFGQIAYCRLAIKNGFMDIPNNISQHSHPVPIGSGLVIALITLAGGAVFLIWHPDIPLTKFLAFAVGGAVISIVGWWDDLHPLPIYLRFIAQSLAAAIAMAGLGGFTIAQVPGFNAFALGWLSMPLTFLWIVGLTNAFNFIDGIDGLAGSQALAAGSGWAVIGWVSGDAMVMMLGLLIIATSLSFLTQNWQPARVFMGDGGSSFLGYAISLLPLMTAWPDATTAMRAPLVSLMSTWLIIWDTFLTFNLRLLHGESVLIRHHWYLFHRLVNSGCSHSFVTLLYFGLSVIGNALAVAWLLKLLGTGAAIVLFFPLGGFFFWIYVVRQEKRKKCIEKE